MPEFKIKFVSSCEVHKKSRKRLTPLEAGIQARLEHLYAGATLNLVDVMELGGSLT
jgi:hypothetical protein